MSEYIWRLILKLMEMNNLKQIVCPISNEKIDEKLIANIISDSRKGQVTFMYDDGSVVVMNFKNKTEQVFSMQDFAVSALIKIMEQEQQIINLTKRIAALEEKQDA